MTTEEDDCAEMFDVGTAVANPYVCDAWHGYSEKNKKQKTEQALQWVTIFLLKVQKKDRTSLLLLYF